MITGTSAGGHQISVRFNRYLGTYVVDMTKRSVKILSGYPLRFGDQAIGNGVNAFVENKTNKTRYPCDIKDADIRFYSGC